MPADVEFMEKVTGLLSPLGDISSRPMFGGYGVFCGSNMFALISGAALYFKADDSNKDMYIQAGSKQYKPMPYYEVPDQILSNSDKLKEWAKLSIAAASKAKKGKK
jgi:DNA transformation protein